MHIRFFILILASNMILSANNAQAPIDTLLAQNHILLGDSLFKKRKTGSSAWHFRKAAGLYHQAKEWRKYFECLNKLSSTYSRAKKYDSALIQSLNVVKESRVRLGFDNLAEAKAFYNIGIIYRFQALYDSAILSHQIALRIRKKRLKDLHPDLAASYYHLGTCFRLIEDYERSLDYFNKILQIEKVHYGEQHLQLANTYTNIASIYAFMSMYNSALSNYSKALSIRQEISGNNHPQTAETLYNIGLINVLKGDYRKGLGFYQKSLKGYESHLEPNHTKIGLMYNQIGIAHLSIGSYNLSFEYLNKALSIWTENHGDRHLKISYAHNNLGLLYDNMGKYDLALDHLQKALSIKKEVLGANHELLASSYDNIGLNFLAQENFDSAVYYLKLALEIQIQNFTSRNPDVSFSYTSLGKVEARQGHYKKAVEYHESALAIRKDLYGSKHPDLAISYNSIASILLTQENYPQALTFYHNALRANLPDFHNSAVSSLPQVSVSLNHNNLLTSLQGKAIALEKISETDGNITYLKLAFANLQLCDTIADQIRIQQLKHADKLELGKTIAHMYENGIRIGLKLYKSTNERTYKNIAFHFAEKSKSEVLSKSVNNLSARRLSLLPDSLINVEQNIKIDKNYYSTLILHQKTQSNGYDTTKYNYYNDQLFQLNRRHDSLVLVLEKVYPEYHQLKYKDYTISVKELQRKIPKNSALIEYFVGDSSLYLFSITKDDFEISSINDLSALNENIDQFREVTDLWREAEQTDSSYFIYISSAQSLYNTLIRKGINSFPKKGSIKNLIIVPDGRLSYIPFELLIAEDFADQIIGDYSSLTYLIKDYNISYAYSATLNFQDQLESNRALATNGYLGFAPDYQNNEFDFSPSKLEKFRNPIGNLEWNQREIKQASLYMGGEKRLAQFATESSFKREIGKYNIIHLAMHALINDKDPMLSKLVFAHDGKDTINDGYLHTYELFNMEMNPELVVLSACNTGFGKLERGEGINSLAYAFAYAGCPSIVMSQWQVDDKSTSQLMTNFYKNISEGMDKSSALRSAKLEFLKDPSSPYANPSYWGGFVLIGDTKPIHLTRNNYLMIGLSVLSFILLVGIYIMYRRRKASF